MLDSIFLDCRVNIGIILGGNSCFNAAALFSTGFRERASALMFSFPGLYLNVYS